MSSGYEGSGSQSSDPEAWKNSDLFISIDEAQEKAECWLECLEEQIADAVSENLEQCAAATFQGSDDEIFQPFNWYVVFCCETLIPQRSVELWLSELADTTRETEVAAGRRIHKGAPLFNVGLALFAAGNFDKAVTFIAEAGREDEASGRGPADGVLIGANELSSKILVDPLCEWLASPSVWGNAYSHLTGIALSKLEYISVLDWASKRLTDALQVVVSLQRFAALQVIPDNAASRHLRMQAIGDLVLVVESSMRRWQSLAQGQLDQRIRAMLACNPAAAAAYEGTRRSFGAQFPGGIESVGALNWLIDDCLRAISSAGTRGERIGIACYLVVRLRNNLAHVIDDGLNLYSDTAKQLAVSAVVFSVIRVSRFAEEGTLPAL
jgi:hypothetical protein